jgi:hypothetical protein
VPNLGYITHSIRRFPGTYYLGYVLSNGRMADELVRISKEVVVAVGAKEKLGNI